MTTDEIAARFGARLCGITHWAGALDSAPAQLFYTVVRRDRPLFGRDGTCWH